MNLPGDDLFKLIKSLTPSEKRYFKLFTERQGITESKSYLKIFDLIESMDGVYNEDKLKKKLKVAAEIKMLPQMKIYLNDLILKSMRIYRSDKFVFSEIADLIQDELFYTEKGLVELRAKVLKRSKELAYKHDLMNLVLSILQREKIYSLRYSGKQPLEVIEELHNEEKEVIETLNVESELGRISYSLWAQYLIDPLLNDKEAIHKYNDYKNNALLKDYSVLKTFSSKWNYLRAYCLICRFNDDNVKAIEYYKKAVELFDEYPHQKYNVNANYIDALSNYLGACHRASIYDDFEEVIARLEALPSDKISHDASILTSICSNKILYIMNTGKFELCDEVIELYHKMIGKYEKMLSSAQIISNTYNIAVILFVVGRNQLALEYCEKILNANSNSREELQHGAKVLNLLLHYELENKLFLDSLIRNTSRSMQKDDRFDFFEKLVMKYLKSLLKAHKHEKHAIYQEMFDALLKMKHENTDYKFVIMTETLGWIKSKMDNLPLTETIYLKYE